MRLEINYSKCDKCGLCLIACPKQPKDYSIFNCNCKDKLCLHCCPYGAITEMGGVAAIDRKKCRACGDCITVCKSRAILMQGAAVKCDLCLETGVQKCVEACPSQAISLKYDDGEQDRIKTLMGWSKRDYHAAKELEKGDGFRILLADNRKIFSTDMRRIGYDEARIVSEVIQELKENSREYGAQTTSDAILKHCRQDNLAMTEGEMDGVSAAIKREMKGYSALDDLLDNGHLEEIAVLGEQQPVYVYHKTHGWLETDIVIESDRKIIDLINRMSRGLGRRITLHKPRLNANIPLGRIHAAIGPVSSGACLTIRKFNKEPFTPRELIVNRTVSADALAFLWLAVQCDFNMMICGNTGSGKTSTLNTLFSFVPDNERVILIEETPEIALPHNHAVKLLVNEEIKIGLGELITDTLRMRPDRIVVGEVRSAEEARALMNTMLAGQGRGSFSTFHAQSGAEALIRLKSLGISAVDLCALDLIVVQRRWTRYGRRAENLRRVTEICGINKGTIAIEPLFAYDNGRDALLGKSLFQTDAFKKICFSFNFSRPGFGRELKRRAAFLRDSAGDFGKSFRLLNEVVRDGNISVRR